MTTSAKPNEGMSLPAFQAARQALRDAARAFEVVVPNCKSCKNFNMGGCQLHGDVPAEFQAQVEACADWQYDAIPFASSDFAHDMVTSKARRMASYDF